MLVNFGRRSAKFILIFAVVVSMVQGILIYAGLDIPKPLRLNLITQKYVEENMKQLKENATNYSPTNIFQQGSLILAAWAAIGGLITTLAMGLPLLVMNLSDMFYYPFVIIPLMLVAGLMQVSMYLYLASLVLRWVRGVGE